jgi:hypothetical protein
MPRKKNTPVQTTVPGTRPSYMDEIDPLCQEYLDLKAEKKKIEDAMGEKIAAIAVKCNEKGLTSYRYTPAGDKPKLFTSEVENSWRCRNAGKEE